MFDTTISKVVEHSFKEAEAALQRHEPDFSALCVDAEAGIPRSPFWRRSGDVAYCTRLLNYIQRIRTNVDFVEIQMLV
ncbi:MAG: hypothetical protein ACKPKO_14820, partial [Candidatus Fonsibacter sp.]